MFTSYKIKLYNVPENIKGGLRIHGVKDKKGKEVVVRFHHLDGNSSRCTIEGTKIKKVIRLAADTPLVTLPDDEYKIDEEIKE